MLRRSKKAKEAREAEEAEEELPRRSPHGTRLLVVDNDEDACELFARVFDRAGYEAARCYDLDDAIERLTDGPVALVVIAFSGGRGINLKLLEAIRSHSDQAIASVRVVLVAANGRNRAFTWQSGVDGFLSRPLHSKRLLGTVADVLGRSKRERVAHRRAQLEAAENDDENDET